MYSTRKTSDIRRKKKKNKTKRYLLHKRDNTYNNVRYKNQRFVKESSYEDEYYDTKYKYFGRDRNDVNDMEFYLKYNNLYYIKRELGI